MTARLDDNATRLSAIEAKVSATQPEPAVPVLDLNLAAVPDAVLPPLWVPADKHREPMAMARAHDTGEGLTSRAGLDRKAGPLDTAVTTMVLAANPCIAVRRVTDATSDVTRTAESQELVRPPRLAGPEFFLKKALLAHTCLSLHLCPGPGP